jgi:hypothetical protein
MLDVINFVRAEEEVLNLSKKIKYSFIAISSNSAQIGLSRFVPQRIAFLAGHNQHVNRQCPLTCRQDEKRINIDAVDLIPVFMRQDR